MKLIRQRVAHLDQDRVLAPDIELIRALVASGALVTVLSTFRHT